MGGSKVEEASFSGESRTTGGEQGWEIQREIYSQSVGAGMQQPRWVNARWRARAQTGMVAEREGERERCRRTRCWLSRSFVSLSLSSLGNGID